MNPLLQSWMIRTRAEMDADPFRQFDLLPFDGCCRVRIVRAEATVTKRGNRCASLVLEPEGEGPEGRGVRFFWQVPVEGINWQGLPNVTRFGELLLSRGMSDQGMRQALNMRFDKAANLAKYLQRHVLGKTIYVNVERASHIGSDGTEQAHSAVRSAVTKAVYEARWQAGATRTHWIPGRREQAPSVQEIDLVTRQLQLLRGRRISTSPALRSAPRKRTAA